MAKPTEEEMELLTDEEREALDYDEDSTDGDEQEEVEEKPEDKPEEEEGDAEGDQEETDDKPDEQDDKPEEKPEESDEPELPEAATTDEIPVVEFKPKPVDLTPEVKAHIDAEAKKVNADLDAQLAGLKEKYDEGEIDTVEYFDQASVIKEEIASNKADIRDAIRSQFMEQETSKQRWEAEQDAFFKMNAEYDAPVYKDNKLVSGNPILYGALDAACQKISRENPALSGIDLLIKAKAEVDTLMGRKVDKKDPAVRPSAPRPGRNVGDLQTAAPESTAGEFSHLDKLTGDALEDALDKLPAEKRDRYLAGA